MYSQTGYKLEGELTVLSDDSFTDYFRKYFRVYTSNNAAFDSVERHSDFFALHYTVPATDCAKCDIAGIVEGVCAHEWSDLVYFTTLDLYV